MAHCNRIFGQMLKLIPRHRFSQLEEEHGAGRPGRGRAPRHGGPPPAPQGGGTFDHPLAGSGGTHSPR